MFSDEMKTQLREIAGDLDVPAAALMAVVAVESGGRLSARVEGREEPLIRFEGHYFYRLLPRAKRNRAVAAGLEQDSHPALLPARRERREEVREQERLAAGQRHGVVRARRLVEPRHPVVQRLAVERVGHLVRPVRHEDSRHLRDLAVKGNCGQ